MISLRIDRHTEQKLKHVIATKGVTQSEYVRQLLIDSLNKETEGKTPWELGHELFGKHGSGEGDLSTQRKSKLKEKLREKKSRH